MTRREAAEFVLRVRDAARSIPEAVATVGELTVEPGVANVIPERVDAQRRRARTRRRASRPAGRARSASSPRYRMSRRPWTTRIAGGARRSSSAAAYRRPSSSRAPATTQASSPRAGVRCGMLFVRSLNDGISHSPEELTSPEDMALAVDVLTATL